MIRKKNVTIEFPHQNEVYFALGGCLMMEEMLRVAPIFSDHIVLQHGKPVPVWGTGKDGTVVHLSWDSGTHRLAVSTRIQNGTWRFMLPPLAAGLHGTLTIKSGEKEICFHDVVTGDVWFAGGQSNMELELQNCLNGKAELATCANPNIRFYQVVKRAFVDEEYLHEEAQNCWHVCAPDTAATLSAVAYFFAHNINADLGIPIGIINCSWGGTSISAWMSDAQLRKSSAGQRYLDDYAALVGDKTDAQYDAEMAAYADEWNAWDTRIRSWLEKEPEATWETLNKACGSCPWPQPAGRKSPFCPTNLYYARVKRAAPYGIKGFLYYQGEEGPIRRGNGGLR
jgi:sialate O-acetylesterase